jgi:hypothetical protein
MPEIDCWADGSPYAACNACGELGAELCNYPECEACLVCFDSEDIRCSFELLPDSGENTCLLSRDINVFIREETWGHNLGVGYYDDDDGGYDDDDGGYDVDDSYHDDDDSYTVTEDTMSEWVRMTADEVVGGSDATDVYSDILYMYPGVDALCCDALSAMSHVTLMDPLLEATVTLDSFLDINRVCLIHGCLRSIATSNSSIEIGGETEHDFGTQVLDLLLGSFCVDAGWEEIPAVTEDTYISDCLVEYGMYRIPVLTTGMDAHSCVAMQEYFSFATYAMNADQNGQNELGKLLELMPQLYTICTSPALMPRLLELQSPLLADIGHNCDLAGWAPLELRWESISKRSALECQESDVCCVGAGQMHEVCIIPGCVASLRDPSTREQWGAVCTSLGLAEAPADIPNDVHSCSLTHGDYVLLLPDVVPSCCAAIQGVFGMSPPDGDYDNALRAMSRMSSAESEMGIYTFCHAPGCMEAVLLEQSPIFNFMKHTCYVRDYLPPSMPPPMDCTPMSNWGSDRVATWWEVWLILALSFTEMKEPKGVGVAVQCLACISRVSYRVPLIPNLSEGMKADDIREYMLALNTALTFEDNIYLVETILMDCMYEVRNAAEDPEFFRWYFDSIILFKSQDLNGETLADMVEKNELESLLVPRKYSGTMVGFAKSHLLLIDNSKPPSGDLCSSFYVERGSSLKLPTPVFFDIRVHEILSIEQNSMSFATKLQIVEAWYDDRMRWLPTATLPLQEGGYHGCVHICGQINERCCDDMWYPEYEFYNLYDPDAGDGDEEGDDGRIWQSIIGTSYGLRHRWPLTLNLKSPMKFGDFPLDTQELAIIMRAKSNIAQEMEFVANTAESVSDISLKFQGNDGAFSAQDRDAIPIEKQAMSSVAEWKLIGIQLLDRASDNSFEDVVGGSLTSSNHKNPLTLAVSMSSASEGAGTYSLLKVAISVERIPDFYYFNFVISVSILQCVSWLCFVLPPDSIADRLALTGTSILGLFMFQLIVNDYLPPTSDVTLLHSFFICSNGLLMLVGLESVAVYYMTVIHAWSEEKKKKATKAKSRWQKARLVGKLIRVNPGRLRRTRVEAAGTNAGPDGISKYFADRDAGDQSNSAAVTAPALSPLPQLKPVQHRHVGSTDGKEIEDISALEMSVRSGDDINDEDGDGDDRAARNMKRKLLAEVTSKMRRQSITQHLQEAASRVQETVQEEIDKGASYMFHHYVDFVCLLVFPVLYAFMTNYYLPLSMGFDMPRWAS